MKASEVAKRAKIRERKGSVIPPDRLAEASGGGDEMPIGGTIGGTIGGAAGANAASQNGLRTSLDP